MSWSIYLCAPKAVIVRELEEAQEIIERAIVSLEETPTDPKDLVSVNVSGYVSWDDNGIVAASTSQSHNVTRYVPPTPPLADAYDLCSPPAE